ncbi:unnamed protein product, partial [Ectocarpus sp. 13 AM-2016]
MWLCLCLAKLCWQYTDAQDACVRLDIQGSLFTCLERKNGGPGQRQGAPMMGVGGQASAGPGSNDGGGGQRGGMDVWPSLVPDCSPGAAVAGTSEMRRLDELDIALRLAKHSGDASPLLRREVVLALGVLVLNPAHFPFFVTVAQELAINRAAAAAAAARKEAARWKSGKGAASNGGGSESSCPAECGDRNVSPPPQSGSRGSTVAGGGGLMGRLSTSPPLRSSRWVLPSPRLSSSVNSCSGVALGGIGSHGGAWRGADANCGDAGGSGTTDWSTQQQQQQQQQWPARAGDANSVARGLVPGKIGWRGGSVGCADREQQQATPNLGEGVLQSVGAEAAQHYA